MVVIGQAVNDGHAGVLSEGLDIGVGKGPDHHHIDHRGDDFGGILDRFTPPQLRILPGQKKCAATQLRHTRLEGNPGASRGFSENHGQDLALHAALRAARAPLRLECDRSVDKEPDFIC